MVQRKRNIAGYYDDMGRFRPIRSPQFVGSSRRKATGKDRRKYSKAKAGDLGKNRQMLAREDVFDREIRLAVEANEKAEKQRQAEWKEIERETAGTRDGGRIEQTLMQFVRSAGGIRRTFRHGGRKGHSGKRSSYDAGEIDRLSYKQTGKRGLTSDKGGKDLDGMFKAAREAGYPVSDIWDLVERVEDEAAGGSATYPTHGFQDYRDNPAMNRKSDLYVNQLGRNKFAVYLKTYQLKTFRTKAGAEAYIKKFRARAKQNPAGRIEAGQTLTARSIGDQDVIFRVEVLERKGNFVKVKTDMGETKRCKVYTSPLDGEEYVKAYGNYSMAPIFRAPTKKNPAGEKIIRRRNSQPTGSLAKRPAGRKTNPESSYDKAARARFVYFLNLRGYKQIAKDVKAGGDIEAAVKAIYGWEPPKIQAKLKQLVASMKKNPKKNPLDLLNVFTTAAVGIASALQIGDHLKANKAAAAEDAAKRKKRGTKAAQSGNVVINPSLSEVNKCRRIVAAADREKEAWVDIPIIRERNPKAMAKKKNPASAKAPRVASKKNPKRLAPPAKMKISAAQIASMLSSLRGQSLTDFGFKAKKFLGNGFEYDTAKLKKAFVILNGKKENPKSAASAKRPVSSNRANPKGELPKGTTIKGSRGRWTVYKGKLILGIASTKEEAIARARETAAAMGKARRNPATKKPAPKKNGAKVPHRRTFAMFQGRPASTMKAMPVSKHAPARLDQLGDLIELKLTNGQVLKTNPKRFKLCAAGGRLWVTGGKFAKPNPADKANVLNPVAEIAHVVYGTRKPHHGDHAYTHYIHKLGEESGRRPILAVDREGYPVIRGGNYTIEARGIVD